MDYYEIFKGLNESGVDYLVVGGVAVNFHGVPRMTYDLDIMIGMDKANITCAISCLLGWGFSPRLPVDPMDFISSEIRRAWKEDRNMRAFSLYHEVSEVGEIDLVFDVPMDYSQLRERAVVMKMRDQEIPVIAVRDLIAVKEASDRAQDRDDAESLKKAIVEG